jgi:hypothetical protein
MFQKYVTETWSGGAADAGVLCEPFVVLVPLSALGADISLATCLCPVAF